MASRRKTRLTQVLRELEREVAGARACEYRFGEGEEYRVCVAESEADLLSAWRLVYETYLEKEYAAPNHQRLWYSLHDALPETTTFLVRRDGEAVACLSVVFDSPLELPADDVYAEELNYLRRGGRRVCELASLASSETNLRRGVEVTRHLFKLAYLLARRVAGAADMVMTVNPRHVRFYKRTLLFEEAGGEREYRKVGGAPAVLLRLNLETAERRYEERYGRDPGSLFRFFVNPDTDTDIVEMLETARGALQESTLRRYFVSKRRLIQAASPQARAYLQECYLAYDLDQHPRKKSDTRPLEAIT